MAPGNDATFLWRHAVDRRFGAAVDNTRRCRHPIPASLLRPLPFPRFTRVRATPMVSLGCGHRRAAERSGLYQTQPLNLPLGAPRRAINLYGFGSVRGLGFGVSPRALALCERTNEAFDLPTNRGRQKPSEPSAYAVVGFGRDDPSPTEPSTYAVGSVVKGHGPDREGPTTDVETAPLASQPLRRRDSLRQGVSGRLRTFQPIGGPVRMPSPCERHRHLSVPPIR